MKYKQLIDYYKNNQFRLIDQEENHKKFYLLRSVSKANTFKDFCKEFNLEGYTLDDVLDDININDEDLINYIKRKFKPKTEEEIKAIEVELNKMQNFDWGGSAGNNLEKNIVNNVIKKTLSYDEIQNALAGSIQRSVYGYTLNSWYNHWSSIMIEEIFNAHPSVIPTIDLVEKIDFFIKSIPFDLKVTYFPEELMKEKIADKLKEKFGAKSELICCKRLAKTLNIAIPEDLDDRSLTICLQNLFSESIDSKAIDFMNQLKDIKQEVYTYYLNNPKELIIWLYENQGEMRFDAANRFYVVLIDREKPFESWKLKRNVNLLKEGINEKINSFDKNNLNLINFYWFKDGKTYSCYSELLFIYK